MKAEKPYRRTTPVIPLCDDPEKTAIILRRLRAVAVRRRREMHHRERIERRIIKALVQLEDLRQEFIARLDLLHGDADLEPGCDNDVNVSSDYVRDRDGWRRFIDDLEADLADDEPSLGAPEGAQVYTRQRCGDHEDHEEDCDDEGGQCDDEGHDSDTEPEMAGELCAWRSGEVDQGGAGFCPPTGVATHGYRQTDPVSPWRFI